MSTADRPSPPSTSSEFRGATVLVVGASRGIGAEIAATFARHGATVVAGSRDQAKLAVVVRGLQEAGSEAVAVPVDASDESSVRALGGLLRSSYPRLRAAVNNAGEGFAPVPLAEIPSSEFDRVMGVSARGTFLCLREELPILVGAGGGAIVNLASTAGWSAYPGGGPYVAAKHAVIGLTKAAALDYAAQGVRVNALAPGPIENDRLRAAPEEYRAQARRAVPLRRLGLPREVAEAALWLCSTRSSFVTGATLAVDGGRSAGWSG
jgi:NAD(P)-dependent dehydrogenase (short-subunit alcohol dehydrogenase family)